MKTFSLAAVLAALAGSVAAQVSEIQCEPTLTCFDTQCTAIDPTDITDSRNWFREPMGNSPAIFVDTGRWIDVERSQSPGLVTWSGGSQGGEQIMMTVNRRTGDYMLVRRVPEEFGRAWVTVGNCRR